MLINDRRFGGNNEPGVALLLMMRKCSSKHSGKGGWPTKHGRDPESCFSAKSEAEDAPKL